MFFATELFNETISGTSSKIHLPFARFFAFTFFSPEIRQFYLNLLFKYFTLKKLDAKVNKVPLLATSKTKNTNKHNPIHFILFVVTLTFKLNQFNFTFKVNKRKS